MTSIQTQAEMTLEACMFAGRSIVPDIAVFAWAHIPLDQNGDIQDVFTIPPGWSIEILSPDQSPTRVRSGAASRYSAGSSLGAELAINGRRAI